METVPDWRGKTVAIVGSGPSLSANQVERLKTWRYVSRETRRVVVINNGYRMAPWADMLYACDAPWWNQHFFQARSAFQGEMWTQDLRAVIDFGLHYIEALPGPGLGRAHGVIHQGAFGGYQVINLAWQAGAVKVILLGFDMHGGIRPGSRGC